MAVVKGRSENVAIISSGAFDTSGLSSGLRTAGSGATYTDQGGNTVSSVQASHVRLTAVSIRWTAAAAGGTSGGTMQLYFRPAITTSATPTADDSDLLLASWRSVDASAANRYVAEVGPIYIGYGELYVVVDAGTPAWTTGQFLVDGNFEVLGSA